MKNKEQLYDPKGFKRNCTKAVEMALVLEKLNPAQQLYIEGVSVGMLMTNKALNDSKIIREGF